MDNSSKNILIIFLIVLIFYLMSVLSSLLIPLILAFLFAILFQPLISLLKKIKLPNWLILSVISIVSLLIAWGLLSIMIGTTSEIISQKEYLLSRLELKLNNIIIWLSNITGRSFSFFDLNAGLEQLIRSNWFTSAAGRVASGIGSFTGSFVMFALYYIVLLSGMSNYPAFVRYVGGKRQETFLKNYETIQKSILAYILTKTLINLSTGALVTIICLIFGIKFALFWGLLVFLLNFVPQIGSVLGILPIVMMGLIQFDSIQAILLLIILTEAVLFTMGNVLEPKVMGSRLRLNTITVLFGLVFWGYLWGIAGMMLSIPLMVIIKLTFDNIPSFHVFGRVMGYPEKK